ncbi:pyruvate dehydrogenase E1 component subunit alpha, somatic form, mitochondrial-like [Synchiropus splendidus]|uniref:pyruvate dehydrogenase E1 component subunit alpha, somatic form, mitochondrial-like n=1 Tax=Synchiropus splendidus TaxID=270530 RepID=UPI00237DE340|nr:pyruvate dehydrogenase E1 component subunit alpha, somatic form, mitochondrial-like [Synchiropus splendidus]
MQTIRILEQKTTELFEQKVIRGACHMYDGQEACAVGVEASIQPSDHLITGYRTHGFMVTRGASLKEIVSELAGRRDGVCKGKGGSMHLQTKNLYGGFGIVGSQVPLGCGLAFACKYRNTDKLCVCLYGDGASNQGQVHESFNMASLWNLPVIFVCENNLYGKGTHVGRASANTDLYKRGDNIPGMRVDGMDVLCVKEASRFAVNHCRSGKGPIILELMTCCYRGHMLTQTSHETPKEVQDIRKSRDAIKLLKNHMLSSELTSVEELQEMNDQIVRDVEEAAEFSLSSPEPPLEDLCSHIFCNNSPFSVRGVNPWTHLVSLS